MPELRQNFATKEWVVIAPDRARRPEEMAKHAQRPAPVAFVPTCPFCPRNEGSTPPEVLRVPVSASAWHVRVVPNKFAALSREAKPEDVPSLATIGEWVRGARCDHRDA